MILKLLGVTAPSEPPPPQPTHGPLARDPAAEMLYRAGPGHMVLGVTWRDRQGIECTIRKAFLLGTPASEIAAWKRGEGWPGHQGRWWDYFRDDIRRLFGRLFGRPDSPPTS